MNWTEAKDGGNAKGVYIIKEMLTWDKPDLSSSEEVSNIIDKYFRFMAEVDSRPLVSGLANALGIDRRRMREIALGIQDHSKFGLTEDTRRIIADAYNSLEVAWEYNFANGKINPVTGIFLGRNHFGYQDRSEVVIIPKNPMGAKEDEEKLTQRLLASIPEEV